MKEEEEVKKEEEEAVEEEEEVVEEEVVGGRVTGLSCLVARNLATSPSCHSTCRLLHKLVRWFVASFLAIKP